MKENKIICLENNNSFLLLNKVIYEEKVYYLVVGISKEKEIMLDQVKFIEEKIKNQETYVKYVTNIDIITKLTNILINSENFQ